jgi:hypothetical protein
MSASCSGVAAPVTSGRSFAFGWFKRSTSTSKMSLSDVATM